MQDNPVETSNSTSKIVLVTLLVILAIVLGFHILLPLLGIAIVISATMWGIAISAIVLISIAILLFFLISGIAVIFTSIGAAFFVVVAIIAFPLLLPILAPLLLLMLAVALLMKRRK